MGKSAPSETTLIIQLVEAVQSNGEQRARAVSRALAFDQVSAETPEEERPSKTARATA